MCQPTIQSARGTAGAEGKRRDRLRAAHLEDLVHAERRRRAVYLRDRPGASDTDRRHARDLRRNHRHHHRTRQR